MAGAPNGYYEFDPAEWMERAACAGMDQAVFFPERGASKGEDRDPTAAAKAVCAGCEVRVDCLRYAMARPEKWGVWGGTSERERRRLRRLRRKQLGLAYNYPLREGA